MDTDFRPKSGWKCRTRVITAELSRTAIARARFELPTHRDADTPLIRELMSGYR
jgi:hypothetical protein